MRFLKFIFFAVIAIVLSFILLESALRVIGFDKFNEFKYAYINSYIKIQEDMIDPLLLWKCTPEFEFRGREHSLAKDYNVFRIICLGDSVTQGFIGGRGLFMEVVDTYPYKLEEMLNTNYNFKKFEVINAGISGYGSLLGLRYFQRDILKYHPDMIIVNFGMNDARPAIGYSDKERERKILNLRNGKIYGFLVRSKAFQLLWILKYKMILEINKHKNKTRVSLAEFKDNLINIYNTAIQYSIKVILLNNVDIDIKYALSDPYNKVLEDLSTEYNIPLVDIVKATSSIKERKNLFTDNHHLTPDAHTLVAREIYKTLLKEGIVGRE